MNWLKKSLTTVLAALTLFGTGISTPIVADDGDPKGVPASETTATAAPAATATPVATAAATVTPISYPVFDYAETVDGVVVTLHADEGILAKGTTAKISSVTTQVADGLNGKFNEYKAFDINLYDANGNIISNDSWNGKVSVTFSGTEIESMKEDADTVSVVNVDTAGNIQETKDITNETANSVSFEAEHFSIYVIGTTALKTYNFLDVNGTTISSQQVKSNDILEDPGAPSIDGYKFIGWNTSSDGKGDTFTAFGIQTVSDSGTVNLYATYKEVHYVFFMDNAGRIYTTKEGVSGDVITTDVTFPLGSKQGITGWYTDSALTNKVDSITLGMENVTLYPNVESGFWITYNTNGGSFIDPVFVAPNTTAAAPTEPTRAGYTFAEWVDANGTAVNPATTTETMTLYAKWNANTDTQYTIVYWIENANDTNYSYESSSTGYGTTGNEVILKGNAVSTDNHVNSAYKDYFRYENGNYDTGLTINGDGSTKVNVYFSRNTYTIKFTLSKDGYISASSGPGYNYYDINYTTAPVLSIGVADYSTTYEFTAKFEQDISKLWPTAANVKTNPTSVRGFFKTTYYLNGFGSNVSKRLVLTKDLITDSTNNSSTSYTAKWMANLFQITLHYMLQPSNGSKNHSEYIDSTKYQQTLNTDTYNWNAKNIEGFTAEKNDAHTSNENIYFYYTRNSYTLTLHNYDGSEKDSAHLYETDLSSYKNYVPAKPESLKNQPYSFAGWYTDESYTTKYDFTDAKMPANNLILYAKWELPSYNASYYDNMNGVGNAIDLGSISYGNTIAEDTLVMPTISAGSKWVGWTTRTGTEDDYTYTTYNFNTAVTKDVVLYPYYISTEKFAVTYNANGGTGNVTDVKGYAQGAYADVSDNSYTAPEGKVFLNWNTSATGDGVTYYPGDKVKINETNVVLYAQWGDQPQAVTLKYNANGGTGTMDVVSFDTLTNGTTTVLNNGFTAPTNKKFNGWNTDKNGNGTAFEIGEQIGVDNLSSINNILYAQWTDIDAKLNVANNEKIYDATSLSFVATVTGVDATGFVVNYKIGEGEWTTTAPSITNVSESTTVSVKAVKEGCTDLIGSYSLTIKKRPVTFTGETATKEYTGNKITLNGYTVSSGDKKGIISGHTYEIAATSEGTNAGTYAGTITKADDVKIISGNENVTDNYDITTSIGSLTITPVTDEVVVKITGNHDSKVYTGSAQSVSGYTTDVDSKTINVALNKAGTDVATGTDANHYVMGLTESSFTVTSDNYSNIKVVVTDGYLDITPVTDEVVVKITGNHDSKVYTGSAQSVSGYTTDVDSKTINVALNKAGTDVATGTDANHYVMGLTESSFTVTSDNYSNIKVVVTDGYLDITPVTDEVVVKITGNHDSKVYTGSAQSVSGYTTDVDSKTINVALNKAGTDVATGTDANHYVMGLTESSFTVTSDNYSNIKVVVTDGYLDITPVTDEVVVKITGNHDSKVYTGSAQSVSGYTTDVDSKTINVALNKAGTDVATGTDANHYVMGLTESSFTVTSDNYSNIKVVVTDGYLDITPVTDEVVVKITGNHDSKVYTGSAQSVSGYTTDVDSKTINVALNKAGTDVATGTDANHYVMGLTESSFTVTSDNYSNIKVVVTDGYLDITPVTDEVVVKITGNHDSKVYTGSAQSVSGYTTDVDSKTINVALNKAGTDVATGTDANHYVMGLTESSFTVTSDNYSNIKVVVTDGYLDITPVTDEVVVKITGNHDSKVYTGSAQSVSGYTTDVDSKTINVALNKAGTDVATGTDANHYVMGLTESSFTVTSDNYSNIKVVVTDGYLDITPVTDEVVVKITGNHDSKVYTGSAQSVSGYTTDVDSKTINVALNKAGTDVATGTDANHYVMGLTESSFTVTSDNYSNIKVVVTDGYLDITPVTDEVVVKITGNHDSKVYTGSAQSVSGYTTDVDSKTINVALNKAGTDVATGTDANHYVMGLTESSFTVTSDNYSNIKVVVTDGYLDITPVTDEVVVKITGNHDSKVYTGSAQSVSGYTTDVDSKTINVALNKAGTDVATGTDANHYVMGLTESSFTVTSDNYSNIKVVVTDGYLDITPVTDEVVVKIVGDTLNNVYTGKEQGVQAFNVINVSNLLYTGADMSVPEKHLALRTDVGISYMGLTDSSFTNISKNFSNVRFEVTDGYVNITQAKVKVIANKNGKTYGNADPKFSANVIGLVDNEDPELIKYAVTRLNTGTDEAVGTYAGAIVAAGEASQGNYNVSYVPADFTIVASNENAVFATGYTGTYDGSVHSITAKAAQNGSTLYYSTDNQTWSETLPEYTDAAETRTVYVKAVNPNYEDALGKAEVTINKRNVTLTSGTSSKTYDGTALTNENVTVSGEGFVTDEGAVYTVTGKQTEAGTSENAFTYAMNAETKADNYNVTIINGTLTVTERPVTPITPDEPDQPVTPATPETPERPTTPTTIDRPHTPNTGDQTNAGMAAGAFGFSILAAALAIFFKKKYSE